MTHPARGLGFTLVELLVVITIIVVLLSLLAPAMDRAIYQADLAVCGAQLRGLGTGAQSYAFQNRRSYFYREAVHQEGIGSYKPRDMTVPFNTGQTKNINGYDDRPMMRPFVNINTLQCPLAGKVRLDEADAGSYIAAGYANWIGWKFDVSGQNPDDPRPSVGMFRLGDRLGYDGNSYSVLAGDMVDGDWGTAYTSHPDLTGALTLVTRQADPNAIGAEARQNPEQTSTYGHWTGLWPSVPRFDLNYLFDDGSARRMGNQLRATGKANPNMNFVPPYKHERWSILGTSLIPRGR